jgi:hypothetical protein
MKARAFPGEPKGQRESNECEDAVAGGFGHALGSAAVKRPGMVRFDQRRGETVILGGLESGPEERVAEHRGEFCGTMSVSSGHGLLLGLG